MDDEELKRRGGIVINDYQGIVPYYEVFYIIAIADAAERSLSAFANFDRLVKEKAPERDIFSALTSALTHAGSVSRFFFPVGTDRNVLAKARGEKLRTAFALAADSALRNRALRNAIEHYDEDLDRFFLNDPIGPLIPGVKIGMWEMTEEEVGHAFQVIDPEKGIAVILGQLYNFEKIRNEVALVLLKAVEKEGSGGMLRGGK